eukprot:g13916.t1
MNISKSRHSLDWEKKGADETCAKHCKKDGWKDGGELVCVRMKKMLPPVTDIKMKGWQIKASECFGGKEPKEPACLPNGCGRMTESSTDWDTLGVEKTCARDCKKHGWKDGDKLVCVKMKKSKAEWLAGVNGGSPLRGGSTHLDCDCSKAMPAPPFPGGKDTTGCHAKGKTPACTQLNYCGFGDWLEFNDPHPEKGVDYVCEKNCGRIFVGAKEVKGWRKGDGVVCLDPPEPTPEQIKQCEEWQNKALEAGDAFVVRVHDGKKAGDGVGSDVHKKKPKSQPWAKKKDEDDEESQNKDSSHKHKKSGPSEVDDEGDDEEGDHGDEDPDPDNKNKGKGGNEKGGLSTMVIVVIIVGSVLLLGGGIAAAVCCKRARRAAPADTSSGTTPKEGSSSSTKREDASASPGVAATEEEGRDATPAGGAAAPGAEEKKVEEPTSPAEEKKVEEPTKSEPEPGHLADLNLDKGSDAGSDEEIDEDEDE